MSLILVFGMSASGKTRVAKFLSRALGGVVISQDCFYRPICEKPADYQAVYNFDEPSAVDFIYLRKIIQEISEGNPTQIPSYDFSTHSRSEGAVVMPSAFILVEGTMVMCDSDLVKEADVSVFVSAPLPVCFDRRIRRDSTERGIDPEVTAAVFERDVIPMYQKYVLPHSGEADFVVDNSGDFERTEEKLLEIAELLK